MKYTPPLNGDLEDDARPHVNADLGLGVNGSIPDATGYQAIMTELVNAILAADLVPDAGNLSQLAAALALKAPLSSPDFTGNPTAPTQAVGNASTRLATTAFVNPGSLLSTNGYRKFSDGMILQWGTTTTNGSGVASITLPLTFPNNFLVALTSDIGNDPTGLGYGGTSIISNAGLNLCYAKNGAALNASTVSWLAIGN